jgi:hypothetical protein
MHKHARAQKERVKEREKRTDREGDKNVQRKSGERERGEIVGRKGKTLVRRVCDVRSVNTGCC